MDDDGIEIEYSAQCRKFQRDGIEIEIHIFRLEGSDDGWSLEVVDEEDASTVWDELFSTDQLAFAEVMRTIEEEGITAFLRPPKDQLN
jgi:hypothetical protein